MKPSRRGLMPRIEYATVSGRHAVEAYRGLAEQSGVGIEQVLAWAASGDLNLAARQVERRKQSGDLPATPIEKAVLKNRVLQLRERRARWSTDQPDPVPTHCPTCATEGFDLGMICGCCGLCWDGPPAHT
jgi:hypothetical protein